MMQTGILLINLGTPQKPSLIAIIKYLREFLLDPRVIDIPKIIRMILVYLVILPFRPFKAKKAYAKIWNDKGSPLRYISASTATKLQHKLGDNYVVASAMRYGAPSIKSALMELKNCSKIIVLPLFPQYSSAATGSAIAKASKEITKLWNIPELTIINSFYQNEAFIKAYCSNIAKHMQQDSFLLLSYHGLPQRHIVKSNCAHNCKSSCPRITSKNFHCYKAQCYETSRLLASSIQITQYETAFQSRLGKTPWVQPYTDDMLKSLRKRGVKKLTVACPSFVTDCLETLEEMGMSAKDTWLQLGGTDFTLVPSLNNDDLWIDSIIAIIEQHQTR